MKGRETYETHDITHVESLASKETSVELSAGSCVLEACEGPPFVAVACEEGACGGPLYVACEEGACGDPLYVACEEGAAACGGPPFVAVACEVGACGGPL